MPDQHYIIVPKEGDHIPDKQNEDGTICGLYQDDETNKLDGPVRLLAVDSYDDEDESTSSALGLAICGLVGVGIGYAVKSLIDFIKRKKGAKESQSESSNKENELLTELAEMLEEIGRSEDIADRQRVFNIVCKSVSIANDLRVLSISQSLPEEKQKELRDAFDKLTSPEIITSVNQVLLDARNNPADIEVWPNLFADAVKEEKFTPISQEVLQAALQIE